MLKLFELYSRWVPLMSDGIDIFTYFYSVYICYKYKPSYVIARN